MCVYTYMYVYVFIIIHTQPLEEYARKLLTEIAFARGISGARRLTCLPVIFASSQCICLFKNTSIHRNK